MCWSKPNELKKEEIEDAQVEIVNLGNNYLKIADGLAAGGFKRLLEVSLTGLKSDIQAKIPKDKLYWTDRVEKGTTYYLKEGDFSQTDVEGYKLQEVIDIVIKALDLGVGADFEFWTPYHGRLTESKTITSQNLPDGEIVIDKDTLYNEISNLPGLTIVYKGESFDVDDFSGFKFIKGHYQHHFKGSGTFDKIFAKSFTGVYSLHELYEKIVRPLTNRLFGYYKFWGQSSQGWSTLKIDDIKDSFKAYFKRMWKCIEVQNFIADPLDTSITDERMKEWDAFLDKLFNEMFEDGFSYNDAGDVNHINYVLKDQARFAVLDFIMRKYIEIDTEGLDINTIPEKIDNFINDYFDPAKPLRNEVKKILFGTYKGAQGVINPENFKARFFNFLAVTFLADPRTDKMVIPRETGKFFGYNKEAMYFFYDLPLVIAELFSKENFKLEDFYSNIQYSFSDDFFKKLNDKILNGIDISGIFPESSRWPDLNVYEFLSTVISHHMKSTHFQDFTTSGYADMVRADGLSGLVLDYYRQVMNDKDDIPHHILELIIPVKDRTEALDVFNRLIRKRPLLEQDFEETFYNLYYSSSFKVPEQHVFLFKVAQLLNDFIRLDQRKINTVEELKDSIEDIFNNKDINIYKKFEELVFDIFKKEDKQKFILNQGFLGEQFYAKIKELFTNIGTLTKLAVQSSLSTDRLELSWGANIDFWFDTNEYGQRIKFDSSFLNKDSIFLLQKGIKKDLPSDASFKDAMVVVHNIDGEGDIHNGICSDKEINTLPKGYKEGLLLKDSEGKAKIYRNVYVCNDKGFQLFGKVGIDDNGDFFIRDHHWTLTFLKGYQTYLKNIGKDSFKRWSRLENREIDIYSTHFFTVIGYNTGNKYISRLQETTINLVPNPPYKTYLPSESLDTDGSTLSSMDIEDLTFHPIAPISDIIIDTQEFYELYHNIIDFHVQGAAGYSYPNTYILGLLEEVNKVFDPYSGHIDPSSKRSIEDNEGILNRLFKNKAEIRDFLLINSFGDPLHDTDMSIKDWLSFIFDKITDPNLDLGYDRISLLIKEALDGLKRYKTDSGTYSNPFNTAEVWFAETGAISELDHGKLIFDVISKLFGHFTITYLFLHRIDFYEAVSGFKLDFYTINPTSREIESLIKRYNIRASSQESRWDALLHQSISEHIFSILFSNSFMHLPTKTGTLNEGNRVYFGYSPLPFLSDHLSGSSPQELNKKLLNSFKIAYDNYISRRDIATMFTISCDEMLGVFANNLWESISALNLRREKAACLYEQALLQAKYELYRLDVETNKKFSIRYQIENLLVGYHFSHSRHIDSENTFQRKIVFHNLKIQKVDKFGKVILDEEGNPIMEPLTIFLNKDDFKGKNIKVFRRVSERFPELYNTLEQKFLSSTIDKLYTVIHMILKNNGKVRFYTAINRGPQYGYQYINIISGKTFQHLQSYYDINLDLDENGRIKPTEENKLEIERIEHLVALTGTYIEYFNKVKSSVMLIMKEGGAGMGDNSICGINHNNIFKINAIHSKYGAPDGDGYVLQLILGSLSPAGNYFIGPNNDIDPNMFWSRFSDFQPVSQSAFLKYYDASIWN